MEEMEVSQCSSILSMEFLFDEVQKGIGATDFLECTSLCDLPSASAFPPRSFICGQAFSSPPPTSSFLQVAARHSYLHSGNSSSRELFFGSMEGDCASLNVSPPPPPPFAPPLHSAPLPLHLSAPHFPLAFAMQGCRIKNTVAHLQRYQDYSCKRRKMVRVNTEKSLFPTVETSGDSSAEPIPEFLAIHGSSDVPDVPEVAQCRRHFASEPVNLRLRRSAIQ